MHILIIDDDALQRRIIHDALRPLGWRVSEAADGAAGVAAARREPPDIVVCDYQMDGLDGHQTLAALRAHDATATIPFIQMTGATLPLAGEREARRQGVDDYLAKPFAIPDLLAAIESRLARARLLRRQAEEKLNALRTNIVSALPHELKTPLNGIIGFAELMRTDFESFSRVEILSMLNDVHACGLRLNSALDRFVGCVELALLATVPARVAAAREECVEQPAEVIAAAAREAAARHARGTDLHLALDAAAPAVAFALDRLATVVSELVDNACKFSPPGSPVRVELAPAGATLALRVRDAGRGLTAEQARSRGGFVPFDPRRLGQQGAGLGLAIARLAAELHGGSLELASNPGGGTTVTVSLPLARRITSEPTQA